jgi:ABC-type nitrate/sulfonate/bicarbonate transport system ATPase subunit
MPGDAALELLIEAKAFTSPAGLRHVILHDIGLTVPPGQIVALLGRSGGGKSTLLRIAVGLDTAFEGHVRRPPGRLGVVFQEPRLLPWLTVADNLRLVVPGITVSRINDLLELVGVAGSGHHLPSEVSLGMARRVALARALAVDPNMLVLDEPFASLDRQLGTSLAAKVADLARRAGSIAMVATHELEHALAIADRICVLAGRPARLEADIAIPDRGDATAIGYLRINLLDRFPFLGSKRTAHPP